MQEGGGEAHASSFSQNIQEGGKTFGLNWLECLNSNGLPSLNNKFKDLNLQLHASATVTNPYTFNIQGNCSFNASIEADVATYQITCGTSGTDRPFMSNVIGYSSIGWINIPTKFGTLNNTNLKGATIYTIIYGVGNAHGFPMWQIILDKDIGADAITLETLNVKVTIPKTGTSDTRTVYQLQYTNIAPQWYNNNTYELKLYL